MKKVKIRFIAIIFLAVLFAVTLGLALAATPSRNALAAVKEYEPTAVFSQGTGGDVTAYKPASGSDDVYTAFKMTDGGNVYYRRNLALKWFEDETEQNFNLQFKFANVKFETFTMTFESAEENITKEGKTENSLIFKNVDGKVSVYVKNSDGEEGAVLAVADNSAWLTLTLTEGDNIGEFAVSLAEGEETAKLVGTFTNIGGYYLEYRSSAATTPQTPVTFSVSMPEAEEGATEVVTQKLLLRSLNGQSLVVKGENLSQSEVAEDGYYTVTGGKVLDDTAPAIVLNEKVYAFKMGQKFSTSTVNYQVIDVCDSNPTAKLYYYMLKKNDDGEYVKGDTTDYRDITASRPAYFMPTSDEDNEMIYVSLRFDLKGNNGVEDNKYVYLTWYAVDDACVTLPESGANAFDYIKVDRDKKGPQYVGYSAEGDSNSFTDQAAYDEAVANYQDAVNEAAKNLSAGSGANFYLPSLRGLITSDYADYRNLKFSIFYHKPSHTDGDNASSATSLAYNSLKFEIAEQGYYTFRILAVDAASNGMQYYLEDSLVTLSSSNIWDIEGIPEFRFYVGYTGVTIEDPGEQTSGYRDTTYNIKSFEVIALDGVKKDYTLYYFDEEKLPAETNVPTYADFVKNAKKYVEEDYKDCLKEINVYDNDVEEDDEDWDKTDNAYAWYRNSSLSFNPQVSGYYIVKLTVTDPNRSNEVNTAYQVVEVQNPFDYTPGQSEWLQNNVVSIVLFAISAVLLVIVIALFLVKPSDKKVEEVDLKKLKGNKKTK